MLHRGGLAKVVIMSSSQPASARHLRVEKRFDTLLWPDDGCCANGAPAVVDGAENCAYKVWLSRGDWWRDGNALGDVAPAGNSP
jgi:hypothetical protein